MLGCRRRLITPHHIQKRGRRGADEVNNIITLCMEHHDRADNDPQFVYDLMKDDPEFAWVLPHLELMISKKEWRKEHACQKG